MVRVKYWTPEELEELRDDVCDVLDEVEQLMKKIKFLLNKQ